MSMVLALSLIGAKRSSFQLAKRIAFITLSELCSLFYALNPKTKKCPQATNLWAFYYLQRLEKQGFRSVASSLKGFRVIAFDLPRSSSEASSPLVPNSYLKRTSPDISAGIAVSVRASIVGARSESLPPSLNSTALLPTQIRGTGRLV